MKSLRVEQALEKLGQDIADARKRRRISATLMSERLGVTRVTYAKIEKGDSAVGMGNYAGALFVLGKIDELEMIIDRTRDTLGLDLMDQQLTNSRQRTAKGRTV